MDCYLYPMGIDECTRGLVSMDIGETMDRWIRLMGMDRCPMKISCVHTGKPMDNTVCSMGNGILPRLQSMGTCPNHMGKYLPPMGL